MELGKICQLKSSNKNKKNQFSTKIEKKTSEYFYLRLRGFGRSYLFSNSKCMAYFIVLRKSNKTYFSIFLTEFWKPYLELGSNEDLNGAFTQVT